ncbi:hypothetical protein B0H13DRAFT_2347795 [Mycena leptocephala]|nr:hypothetical protein B0H13DRAFT_2347795 [Mycena leptocephala]
MSIPRQVSLPMLLTIAFVAAFVTAESTAAASESSTPAPSSPPSPAALPLSHSDRIIIGVCTSIGVVLIVIASYFCCCHAACRTACARSSSAVGNQDPEHGRQRCQHNVGVPVPILRTSTDKRDKTENSAGSTTSEAPPRYEEI